MATPPTAAAAKQSLADHVTAKGREIHLKYGPSIGGAELQRLLGDRAYVRYPCAIVFDATPLRAGEFSHPEQVGATPEEGFTMYVHPVFGSDPAQVTPLVLYQLVAVNYGDFASSEDAENFGAAALGLTRDEYYALVCELADRLPADDRAAAASAACDGGCHCG